MVYFVAKTLVVYLARKTMVSMALCDSSFGESRFFSCGATGTTTLITLEAKNGNESSEGGWEISEQVGALYPGALNTTAFGFGSYYSSGPSNGSCHGTTFRFDVRVDIKLGFRRAHGQRLLVIAVVACVRTRPVWRSCG